MNLSVGIVGLPNVGKSTLFNALLKKQQALAANYPFATIEPNVGIVPVPDSRLEVLAEITKEEEGMGEFPPIKNALIEFVDIAGLVKGASEGEGLGNKFLSHIREVRVIAHVVRVFEDPSAGSGQVQEVIIREGSVDPKTDYEVIRYELMLADLQQLESQVGKIKNQEEKKVLQDIIQKLKEGSRISSKEFGKREEFVRSLNLLSQKQEIVVLNVTEDDYNEEKIKEVISTYAKLLEFDESQFIVISAKIEAELANLNVDEQKEYLKELGVEKSGLERLIQKAYEKLGLISFLTAGEKEVRAWTIKKGSTAVEAAGEIHTDFMAKFIKAEVVSYDEFVNLNGPASPETSMASRGGWKNARAQGKARMEGRDYIVKDGDVVEFKIGR